MNLVLGGGSGEGGMARQACSVLECHTRARHHRRDDEWGSFAGDAGMGLGRGRPIPSSAIEMSSCSAMPGADGALLEGRAWRRLVVNARWSFVARNDGGLGPSS